MKDRYDALNGLKTLACFGVIANHVFNNGNYHAFGTYAINFINSIQIVVFLFMIISSFSMCCGYYERFINGSIDIVQFYKKRYLKLWPFFAFMCLIDFISSPSLKALYEVFLNLTLCFGFIPNAEISVIGVGWFLGVVFAFYILFPFFCFLIANKKRAWIAFGISLLVHYIVRTYYAGDRRSIVFCFVFFIAGGLVYLYREKFKGRIVKSVAFVVLVIAFIFYYKVPEGFAAFFVQLIINTSLLIIAIMTPGKGVLANKFTKLIGGIGFEIYLCHMMIFRILEKASLTKLTGNDYCDYGITYVLVFVGATIFAYFGKILVDKFVNILYKSVAIS